MLAKLWRFIFGGCEHKWEIISEKNIYSDYSATMPVGQLYTLQCKKCGDIKSIRNI